MYLDTANLAEIEVAMQYGIIEGVTASPSILLMEKRPREEQYSLITDLGVPFVYMQAIGEKLDERLEDTKEIFDYGDNVGIIMPIDSVGVLAIKAIKEEYPERKIMGTAIYSAEQGIIGAMAGCDVVAPFVNRMSNNGIDPFQVIALIRNFIDDRDLATRILSASFKNVNQVTSAFDAGSHMVTIPFNVLNQMLNKSLATKAVDVFNKHGAALKKGAKAAVV